MVYVDYTKKYKYPLLFTIVLFAAILFYLNGVTNQLLEISLSKSTAAATIRYSQPSNTKLVLTWTTFWDANLATHLTNYFANHTCAYRCIFSDDRRLVDDADALIFHTSENINPLPTRRHPHQRYIFYRYESPYYVKWIDRLPANFFNITMTYRHDSDIVSHYDALYRIDSTDPNLADHVVYSWRQVTDAVAGKNRIAMWLVSNCKAKSHREVYVQQLIAAGLDVDIFGKCGQKIGCDFMNQTCEDATIEKYRFYIAFENNVCRDYVTEKFWRMKKLIVPLVLRAKDYQHIAPVGSYIAVDQFQSITQLVTYLKMLSTNTTEYLKYFEWTRTFHGPQRNAAFNDHYTGNCDMCRLLHNTSAPAKSYANLRKWYIDGAECEPAFAEKLAALQNRSAGHKLSFI